MKRSATSGTTGSSPRRRLSSGGLLLLAGLALIISTAPTHANGDHRSDHGSRHGRHCRRDAQCRDGFVCGEDRTCRPGCRIDGVVFSPGAINPDNSCQACRPGISARHWSNRRNGESCDDGNACSTNDTCRRGACGAGAPRKCDDEIACTADSCDPKKGCINAPDDGLCGDENICTKDSCDPENGCANAYVGDGNACEMWVTDGPIIDTALHGDTLYLAGLFDWVSPKTPGSFFALDPDTAELSRKFPEVAGPVHAAVSDRSGGWYIGGSFYRVGDVERRGLAHILADGTVSDWNPCGTPNYCFLQVYNRSGVYDLALKDGVVYAAADEFSLEDDLRIGIAAIDARSGAFTAWKPDLYASSSGYAPPSVLLVDGHTLFAGGRFVESNPTTTLWAIDTETAEVLQMDTTGSQSVGVINDLAFRNGTLYVGGTFDTIDGQPRSGAAAIDVASWRVTPWDPGVTGGPDPTYSRVSALAISGRTLFVGGRFDSIGGRARHDLAAVDAVTGQVTGWNPELSDRDDFAVRALAVDAGKVYAAGTSYWNPRDQVLAAIDGRSGAVLRWDPALHVAEGPIETLATGRREVWVGGGGFTFGGVYRPRLAAIDIRTGRPTDWNPNADCFGSAPRTASQIEAADHGVYVATSYFTDTAVFSNAVEALDPAPGEASCLRWSTPLSASSGGGQGVRVLALGGDALYAGGPGFQVGGKVRAIDVATGDVTSWSPFIFGPGQIDEIATLGDAVYLGGRFTSVNGEPRSNLAGVDSATGLTLPWDPAGNFAPSVTPVFQLEVNDGKVYTAGGFTAIGGQERSGVAALDPSTALASAWDPGFDLGSELMSFDDGIVYFGLGAAVDAETGAHLLWDPAPTGFTPVTSVARDGVVFVGGHIYGFVGGQLRSGIAAIAGASNAARESTSRTERIGK